MTPVASTYSDQSRIVPKLAIIFSGKGTELSSVTSHVIENGMMQTGEYIEIDQLQTILRDVMENRGPTLNQKAGISILPANVLVANHSHLVWYKPSHVGVCWFAGSGNQRLPIKIRWPATLFAIRRTGANKKFYCVALDNDQRPDSNTRVYNFPFPNAYNGGAFCLGSANLPTNCSEHNLSQIESCVYDSLKTHSNNKQALRTGDDPTAYWIRRSNDAKGKAATARKRDLQYLKPLSDWLQEI